MVFPVVLYGYESWTVKKAKHRRLDAFELWCWRRLLRVPWTARRSSQSILRKISPECSLEGLMLKLKLQYFVHLMQRPSSLEKTLMLVKIEGRRRRERQRMGWLHGITGSVDREAWRAAIHRVAKSWTRLSYWTEDLFCGLIYSLRGYYMCAWKNVYFSVVWSYLWKCYKWKLISL